MPNLKSPNEYSKVLQYLKNNPDAIVGLIALIFTIFIAYLERDAKSMKITILEEFSLENLKIIAENKLPGLKFYLNGEEVKSNLSLLSFKLENSGDIDIDSGDFAGPLTIVFPNTVSIIEDSIILRQPNNLPIRTTRSDNILTIFPLLLNRKDYGIINLLLNNSSPNELRDSIKAFSRIKGITEIPILSVAEELNVNNNHMNIYGFIIIGIAFIVLLLLIKPFFKFRNYRNSTKILTDEIEELKTIARELWHQSHTPSH